MRQGLALGVEYSALGIKAFCLGMARKQARALRGIAQNR